MQMAGPLGRKVAGTLRRAVRMHRFQLKLNGLFAR